MQDNAQDGRAPKVDSENIVVQKPKTAYFQFMEDKKEQVRDMPLAERGKFLG